MKCPKCKAEINGDNHLIIEQKFTTTLTGYQDENGELDIDFEVGYHLLWDWLESMLSAEGKPKKLGCQNCLGE